MAVDEHAGRNGGVGGGLDGYGAGPLVVRRAVGVLAVVGETRTAEKGLPNALVSYRVREAFFVSGPDCLPLY
jgi:hypothetical protein